LSQIERNLAASGIELDTYLGMMGKTRDAFKLELRPAAEERLKQRLVMANVAEEERLAVDDETIDAEIDRLSEMMGDRADEMRAILNTPSGRLSVADDLMVARVQERILQIARGEAPALEEETEEAEAKVEGEGPSPEGPAPAGEADTDEAKAEAEDVSPEALSVPEEEIADQEPASEAPANAKDSENPEESASNESD